MKIKQSAILLSMMLALSLSATDTPNRLYFPVAGFSIATLESAPGSQSQASVMMFLAPSDQFTANVNVGTQPYTGTIDDYTALTMKQFKENNIKLIEQKKIGKSVVIFDYTGDMQGKTLHWYARAEKSGDHVYLTTATAAQAQWKKQSAQLKACVDSFRIEAGK